MKGREVPRIGKDLIVVELPKLTHDRVELARIDAGLRQPLAQRLGIALPLAQLAPELTDVIRRVSAVASVPVPAVSASPTIARAAAHCGAVVAPG